MLVLPISLILFNYKIKIFTYFIVNKKFIQFSVSPQTFAISDKLMFFSLWFFIRFPYLLILIQINKLIKYSFFTLTFTIVAKIMLFNVVS